MSGATIIFSVGGMPWLKNRRSSLPCTVRTSQTKVVQLKGWLSLVVLVLTLLNNCNKADDIKLCNQGDRDLCFEIYN